MISIETIELFKRMLFVQRPSIHPFNRVSIIFLLVGLCCSYGSIAQLTETAFVSFEDGALLKVDIENCESTIIGYTSNVQMLDIAITPSGQLFGTDGGRLFRINTSNAETTYIGDMIFKAVFGVNNMVALNDDYLLVVTQGMLYKISTATADTINLGYLGEYESEGDITYLKGEYYLACRSPSNTLIKFTLNVDLDAITSVKRVGFMNTYNDAVFGMLTTGSVSCTNDNLKLIALESNSVYEMNPDNVKCTMICDSIYLKGIYAYGATSTSEVSFQTYEPNMVVPNVFTPNRDNINDTFSPIENTGIKSVQLFVFNRWGKLIYESTGSSFSWDGTIFDSYQCHEGVYYYVLKYSDYCDSIYEMKGFLNLLK